MFSGKDYKGEKGSPQVADLFHKNDIGLNIKEKASGSSLQLMVIFLSEMTRTGLTNVEISIEKVLSLRGMQDCSYSRKQIRQDLLYLDKVQFKYYNAKKGWMIARIGDGNACINKDMLYFQFSTSFLPLIPAKQYMPLPESILHTGKNENLPARFFLTWRICQHKRMNLDRPNADLVSVRSLLTCCPAIPAYHELKHRQVDQRIIEPFGKALDRCGPYFTWEYERSEPATYQDFIDSRVRVKWNIEPYTDTKRLIKAKAKRRSRK